MSLQINLKFYFSSDKNRCINNIDYSFSPGLLDLFNIFYAERLLLNLGYHFIAYHSKRKSNIWNLSYRGNFLNVPELTNMQSKHMLTGISGNTGESLIIPSLTYAMRNQNLNYCRISSAKKCPDFRIELKDSLLGLWKIDKTTVAVGLPTDLPLEVKSHFGSDNDYPETALYQLLSYWTIMVENNLMENVGVGIISRVNLEPNNKSIRYFLFIPRDRKRKRYIEWICKCNVLDKRKIKLLQKKAAELFL